MLTEYILSKKPPLKFEIEAYEYFDKLWYTQTRHKKKITHYCRINNNLITLKL